MKKNELILGTSGSGKSRYLVGEALKRAESGKKIVIVSPEITFSFIKDILRFREVSEVYIDKILSKVYLLNSMFNIGWDELESIILTFENDGFDYMFIESHVLSPMAELQFDKINNLKIKVIYSAQLKSSFISVKEGVESFGVNLDKVVSQFENVTWITKENEKFIIKKSKVLDKKIFGFNEVKVYDEDRIEKALFS